MIVASMSLLASAALSQTPRQQDSADTTHDGTGNSSAEAESSLESHAPGGLATMTRTATTPPVVMVLVPAKMQNKSENMLADGCWAAFYHQLDLQGDRLTLVGPVAMRSMTGPFGMSWSEKLHSLQAGPRATVTIYEDEEFRGRSIDVQSGGQVNDIDLKMGRYEEVNSIRIDCT